MDYSHRVEQANDIPDPTQPATGRYDENEIRIGALSTIAVRRREEIAALKAENAWLRDCIAALEREGLDRAYTWQDYQNHGEPRADGRYEHSAKPVSFRRE